ncbi:MAG: hypothetical protein ACW99F_13595 [Candidatus Hodarchaeales archaeon]|jgi:hypothetical protein
MELSHMLIHGIIYALIGNGYLFLFMVSFSPRIWGYNDYPEVIKSKVPPQTSREKIIAGFVSLPWFLFTFLYPLFSTFLLKDNLGGDIPFFTAYLNIVILIFLFFLGDLIILDWLIISKITPSFVIIPGSDVTDYKDFLHHYKDHVKAILPILVLGMVFAGIVTYT